MSASAVICVSPNISLRSEKIRSARSAAAGARVGSERADDLHRERPRRELFAMVGPEEEDALGELVHVTVVVGRAGALGEVGGQLILESRDVLGNWQAWDVAE